MTEENQLGESLGAKAFAIFANQVASEVSNENSRLEVENCLFQPMRDHLKTVEIRSDDQVVAFQGLDEADMQREEDFTSMTVHSGEGTSLPLAKFGSPGVFEGIATVYMSNQLVGCFPGACYPSVRNVHHDSVELIMSDASGTIRVKGRVNNLSRVDMEKIIDEGEADTRTVWESKTIGRYLVDGEGWNSPNATFTPEFILMIVAIGRDRGIQKTLVLLQHPKRKEREEVYQQLQHSIDKATSSCEEQTEVFQKLQHNIDLLKSKLDLLVNYDGYAEVKKALLKAQNDMEHAMGVREECKTQWEAAKKLLDSQIACYADAFEEEVANPTESNDNLSEADNLPSLVFAIVDRPGNMKLLRQNQMLKDESKNLKDIQAQIGAVEISHGDGKLSVSLDKGFPCSGEDGQELWRVPLIEGQSNWIDANKVRAFQVSLSGVRLKKITVDFDRRQTSIHMVTMFDSGLCLRGCFSYSDLDSLMLLIGAALPPPRFPPGCVFTLISLDFNLSSIKDTLKMVKLSP
mmetsp:Transcript_1111/g.2317  ORF Transcript_1111/g.2317 Transcript_1111/m.2317 type:complete len:518 (+) Transcript_1111:165-1718(+)